jgi:glycogen debranching enzyme
MRDLPHLHTDNPQLNAAFRVALGDLVGNIQPFQDGLLDLPRPCILAGLDYDTPWTRDTAINVWNGAGLLFPDASRHTLLSVLERGAGGEVRVGGQYWDAIIWVTGAWAYFLYTGDRELLALAGEVARNSLAHFEATEYNPASGLFRGPACYGDGVAAYPDRYAQAGGSSSILDWPRCNPEKVASPGVGIPMQALSTNCLYYNAYRLVNCMARALDRAEEPRWEHKAGQLKAAIQKQFWDPRRGAYRYLVDEWGGDDHQEGLGNSFALLLGVAGPEQARQVLANQPITAFGIPCVWPSYDRYRRDPDSFGRHSGTVWPHVQGFWAEAAARAGALDAFGKELFSLAGNAARDGMFAEIYHPLTGEVYGGLQEGAPGWQWRSCLRQTWSATAFLRMALMGLLGMDFSPLGIAFNPTLPPGVSRLALRGLAYRAATLNVTVAGAGNRVKSFAINGQRQERAFLPAVETGEMEIVIEVVSNLPAGSPHNIPDACFQ